MYAATRRLPRSQHRAAWLLARCGRSELGGHLERCDCARSERIVWHSCRHRLCPRCARKGNTDWLAGEAARLLPCAHHHLVFTLPHELLIWWRFNRRRLTDTLFQAAAATLTELLADRRYLGARPGLLLALHTWSRTLALHPHLHALITDGGLDGSGAWRTPRRSHFLPLRVVQALFRGKFLAALAAQLAAGTLIRPPDTSRERATSLLNRLGRVKWHVWLSARYDHGDGVLAYLARYLRGGPLRQPLRLERGRVVLRVNPHDAPAQSLDFAPADWLARFLEHTPVPGQHTLRRYGLYAPAARAACQEARALVTPRTARTSRRFTQHPRPPSACCPHCATPLVFAYRLPPQRSPP